MNPPRLLRIDRHLVEDRTGHMSLKTWRGQAHLAGSGPAGKTCRECCFWAPGAGLAKHAYGVNTKQLKPCACQRYSQLMGGELGGDIPPGALACKYFEAADSAPPIDPKR